MRLVANSLVVLSMGVMLFASAGAGVSVADSTKAVAKPLVNQTLCPVMKKAIDSSAYTDIQGQRVYHCCRGCEKKLRGNPDKYFEEAAREGVVFQNIQKLCPVSGKPIDKKYEIAYNGRRLYFSSAECVGTFMKTPAEYLKKLDTQAKPEVKETADHSGHGH